MFLSLGQRNTKSMGGSWDIDEFYQLFWNAQPKWKNALGLFYTPWGTFVSKGVAEVWKGGHLGHLGRG